MTEQHDNTTTTQNEAVANADGQTATPEGGSAGEAPKANKEARYRVERNEAREALAASEARVERMQRAEIERLAGEHLSMGADLFINGNAVSDYLTEDGDVDAAKVAADVAAVIAERPGLRKTAFFDPSQGLGGRPAPKAAASFSGIFKH